MIKNFLLLFLILFIYGCGGNSPSDLASEYCHCMKEMGLQKNKDLNSLVRELDQKNACAQNLSVKLKNIIKPMGQAQRAEFMREFSKEMIRTECGDILFSILPYKEMVNSLEKDLNRKKENENIFSIPDLSGKPSVCYCVKLGDEMNNELKEDQNKLEEIQEKYKDKIEACRRLAAGLSDEEKRQLMEEAKNCK